MLRLIFICTLLAAVAAQTGYDYNKPDNPFSQGSTRPGFSPGSTGFQGTTPSFPGTPQSTKYASTGTGSTQGISAPSNYPTGLNSGPGGSTQSGYPGQRPSQGQQAFPGQAPSGFPVQTAGGFSGQASSGSSGPSGPNYQSQGQNYPGPSGPTGQAGPTGFGPAGPGLSSDDTGAYEGGDYSAIPGEPDKDYPIFTEIPQTSFQCDAQAYPGYYADVEARCQVFHVCANNRKFDFLCPNGTIFSQQVFVCVWWNQFDCNTAPSFFELNANLYDNSKTGSSSQVGYQGSSDTNQGQGRPQSFPGPSGPQGPNTGYAGVSEFQGPTNNYPATSELQVPPAGYPSSQISPGPTAGYAGTSGPTGYQASPGQGQTSYSGSSGSSYSGQQGSSYSGSGGYPGAQAAAASYSGAQAGSYPGAGSQDYSGSQGYPSGRPSGPPFSNGRTQSDSPQLPTREYLPPRN